MSASDQHHHLTRDRRRATLLVLGAVQFTSILDSITMMPLGAQLRHAFNITPVQFSHLVASGGIAAA